MAPTTRFCIEAAAAFAVLLAIGLRLTALGHHLWTTTPGGNRNA